ncbi:hypothetical protein AGMMS49593_04850 [Endomicrobiia bacterium]|nr:hypothetical protein AGMMS49593_04850 [Endomicrobiia bacterium]
MQALENVGCFGIVSSGNSLNDEEISELCKMFKKHEKVSRLGVFIGRISDASFIKLREVGIKKYITISKHQKIFILTFAQRTIIRKELTH